MALAPSLLAFTLAAALLTVTPGLDTALVLRTAACEGPKRALAAAFGICAGCLAWGLIVAAGLGALLAVSTTAYSVLKFAGAAYLIWLGANLLLHPRTSVSTVTETEGASAWGWFRRGLLTNLLNPKVGVFYVSFLPQFIPAGAPVAETTVLLAAVHAALGVVWFLALIAATRPLTRALQRPGVLRRLDQVTGVLFVGFGLKLALEERP